MKVLVITYYWPPAGGSGVQRWLHFVKYLVEIGVEPVVFTVQNPNFPIEDASLLTQVPKAVHVIRQKIHEPNTLFSKKNKQTAAGFLQENPTFFQKIALYVRANYFIPDARKFWITPSVKTLKKYLESNPVDWIITTGPPHSVHLIGKKLQRLLSKNSLKKHPKWLVDFRDPWTDIDYFHQLPLTAKSLKKHHKLEQAVLKQADVVTVVSETMKAAYLKHNPHTYVITNGYDGKISKGDAVLDTKFSMTHVGMLNADRNPHIFWEVLKELTETNVAFKEQLQVNLIGKVAQEVKESILKNKLEKQVSFTSYIPHNQIESHQVKSQVLLLFVNDVPSAKGIVTGKIFEYLRAKRPLLAIAPHHGDLAQIINETHSGKLIDFKDKEHLKKVILEYFNLFKKQSLVVSSQNISQYHRKNLTKRLVEILNAH